jgi:hypothetical protein
MPEVARCNTIEVGEAVVRAGSKIEARDQVEQPLIGAIGDPRQAKVPRQTLRCSRRPKSSATGTRLVARARPRSKLRVLLEGVEGPQAVMLLQKPRVQVVHVSLFKS